MRRVCRAWGVAWRAEALVESQRRRREGERVVAAVVGGAGAVEEGKEVEVWRGDSYPYTSSAHVCVPPQGVALWRVFWIKDFGRDQVLALQLDKGWRADRTK